METIPDATVITFPTRHAAPDAPDIAASLADLHTDLRAASERLRNLSTAVDRSLQSGDLEHVDDPIAFTANLSDLIATAARTTTTAWNQIQTATELWNSENQQQ